MNQSNSSFDDPAEDGSMDQGMSKGTFRRRAKRQLRGATRAKEPRRPAVGTLARTRTLILAALRVWELKHGIRD